MDYAMRERQYYISISISISIRDTGLREEKGNWKSLKSINILFCNLPP